jgi:hypothetical protein
MEATMDDIDTRLISGEEVVFRTTKHWMAPLADSTWAILMVLGAVLLSWVQPQGTEGIVGFANRIIDLAKLGLFLGGLGWIAFNVVAWRTAQYHVTNRRVLGQDGLVRRRSTDTLLTSVGDVRLSTSAVGRMLGYGDIRIMSSSGEPGADSFTTVRDVLSFKKHVLEQKAGSHALGMSAPQPASAAAAPAASAAPPAPPSASDAMATLAELARLRDAGAITAEDYEAKKSELLDRI